MPNCDNCGELLEEVHVISECYQRCSVVEGDEPDEGNIGDWGTPEVLEKTIAVECPHCGEDIKFQFPTV